MNLVDQSIIHSLTRACVVQAETLLQRPSGSQLHIETRSKALAHFATLALLTAD